MREVPSLQQVGGAVLAAGRMRDSSAVHTGLAGFHFVSIELYCSCNCRFNLLRAYQLRFMFSFRQLCCLGYLVWLRSGNEAAKRLHCDQSLISRNAALIVNSLGLRSFKGDGEWWVDGDATLLNLEREVHQLGRWKQASGLRIDAIYEDAPLYFKEPVDGWVVGNFDFMNVAFPLSLLRDGVIDAWMGIYPDVPEAADEEFSVFHLTRFPAHLVVDPEHPLLRSAEGLSWSDLAGYPFTSLPDQAFPKMAAMLRSLGCGSATPGITRYRHAKWEGRTADQLTISYASPLTLQQSAAGRVVLPVGSPFSLGDSLVVKRKFADHATLAHLLDVLRDRAQQLARQFAEVELVNG